MANKSKDYWKKPEESTEEYHTRIAKLSGEKPLAPAPTAPTQEDYWLKSGETPEAYHTRIAELGGGIPSVTGNEILDNILQSMQDTLTTISDQGKIINPKIDITPKILQGFIDQASTELDPYYKSQFATIKGDLQSDLTSLSDQYGQVMKSQEAQFKQTLAAQRESEAGRGTMFSGGRRTREQELRESAQRTMGGLETSLGYQTQKAGTAAERTLGSAGLSGLSLAGYTPYSVSTAGEGVYTPSQRRQLFAPAGKIVGSLEREQIEKKRAYSDILKSYWLEEQNV